MGTAELDDQKHMRLRTEGGITVRRIVRIIKKRLPSFFIDIPALRPGTVGAYALAVVSVGVATVLRLALDPYVMGVQFITFAPAIIITTVTSGFGAGFLCVVLSTAAADFFVLEPRWSFNVEDPANVANLLLFGPLASYCVILISRMRMGIEREQERRASQASKDQLQASKDRLQLALNAAHLGWWQYDPLRRIGSGDARANEIHDFDIGEDEEVALEELLKRVHPDDVGGVEAAIATALDPADPKPYAHEYRIRWRDGQVRWVENHGLAYFEGAGPERQVAGFVGTLADITERKEHEERLNVLMREVNHRARNLLTVVNAIAHQTVTDGGRFSERIGALAADQDLLVRSGWKGVEIDDLVRAQLSHLAALIGSRIVVRGPNLRLNPAAAQAIGLALHELATNAGKYGALSKDAGRLDVRWGNEGETFTISWTERDGPQVSPPQRRGFGTIVVQEMAERTLNGKVDLDYAPSGLTWRLACPAANALESQP
jgi:PAS domain S-box-containing protein